MREIKAVQRYHPRDNSDATPRDGFYLDAANHWFYRDGEGQWVLINDEDLFKPCYGWTYYPFGGYWRRFIDTGPKTIEPSYGDW